MTSMYKNTHDRASSAASFEQHQGKSEDPNQKQSQSKSQGARSTQSLYQEALLKHHKAPVGFELEFDANVEHKGVNPACGDEITVVCKVEGQNILHLGFHGDSCAICRASASLMSQNLVGQSIDNCQQLISSVNAVYSTEVSFVGGMAEKLSPLIAVKQFPVRQQCAVLPWNTLAKALEKHHS